MINHHPLMNMINMMKDARWMRVGICALLLVLLAGCGGGAASDTDSSVDANAAPPTDIPPTQEGIELNPDPTATPTPDPALPNEVINSAETFTVRYPGDWSVLDVAGTLKFANTEEVPAVAPNTFAEGAFYAALDVIPFDVSGMSGATAAAFLERTARDRGGVMLELGEVEALTLGTLEAATATGTFRIGATGLEVLYIVVINGDAFGVLELYAAPGGVGVHIEDAQRLMGTFTYTPIGGFTRTDTPEVTEAAAEATPGS